MVFSRDSNNFLVVVSCLRSSFNRQVDSPRPISELTLYEEVFQFIYFIQNSVNKLTLLCFIYGPPLTRRQPYDHSFSSFSSERQRGNIQALSGRRRCQKAVALYRRCLDDYINSKKKRRRNKKNVQISSQQPPRPEWMRREARDYKFSSLCNDAHLGQRCTFSPAEYSSDGKASTASSRSYQELLNNL